MATSRLSFLVSDDMHPLDTADDGDDDDDAGVTR